MIELVGFVHDDVEDVVVIDTEDFGDFGDKVKNDEVRQLIANRNDERSEQVLGELKAARAVSDEAYAVVVFHTNAYLAMNPDVREAAEA